MAGKRFIMKQSMARSKEQVYSVGNYLMTGKVLGKGHFARVEEATHRIIGKKVAIKIIDLTCIKEEYARRNLHREPKVMARLRHPCIAALYETMMHGPRLYVVMEAAGGGDLCAHVLSARGGGGGGGVLRGLPETRARHLSTQLVSAVKHMHARGVVHRDLKMENIMLDSTKQFIKIVDFGLSNVWSATGGLRTPCGSLEYAAPELFLDGRRYGPEVDLWSLGVIVYGMVTGSLPFGDAAGKCAGGEGSGRSRLQLRAAIARGFSRKHRAALGHLSAECKLFVQQLLEPVVENRMRIEEAARHRWLRKPGLRLHAHPLADLELKNTRLIARQISELSGQSLTDVVAEIKADPYGSVGGMFNIKSHVSQLQGYGADMLWSNNPDQPRPVSPPIYHPKPIFKNTVVQTNTAFRQPETLISQPYKTFNRSEGTYKPNTPPYKVNAAQNTFKPTQTSVTVYKAPEVIQVCKQNGQASFKPAVNSKQSIATNTYKPSAPQSLYRAASTSQPRPYKSPEYAASFRSLPASPAHNPQSPSSYWAVTSKIRGPGPLGVRKPMYKVHDNGDGAEPRLPSIEEHGRLDADKPPAARRDPGRLRLHSSPDDRADRQHFYRRAGDAPPSRWQTTGVTNSSARILLQTTATTIKRASLGNIVSPHSSTNSHCKSERAVPVGCYARNSTKDTATPLRLRRTAPIK